MRVAVIVLAAGRGTRMEGGDKLRCLLAGQPLYRYALALASDPVFSARIAVCRDAEMERAFQRAGFRTCRNPAPERGIASSIRLGVAAAAPEDALLFLPADQPLLSARTLRRIVEAYARTGLPVVPVCAGTRRAPCLFPPSMREALLALEGDRGGKRLLREREVAAVEVADEREFLDADTADALREIEEKKRQHHEA